MTVTDRATLTTCALFCLAAGFLTGQRVIPWPWNWWIGVTLTGVSVLAALVLLMIVANPDTAGGEHRR